MSFFDDALSFQQDATANEISSTKFVSVTPVVEAVFMAVDVIVVAIQ